jgi:hypothetical protein
MAEKIEENQEKIPRLGFLNNWDPLINEVISMPIGNLLDLVYG